MLRVFIREVEEGQSLAVGTQTNSRLRAFEIDLQHTSARAEQAFSKQAINYDCLIGRPFNEAAECGEVHLCQLGSGTGVAPIKSDSLEPRLQPLCEKRQRLKKQSPLWTHTGEFSIAVGQACW